MKRLFDERQEQEYLKSKRIQMGVVFWIVTLSFVIKTYVLNLSIGYWITELIILFACAGLEIKLEAGKGMFDPYFKPTGKTCLLLSLVSALVIAVAFGIGKWYHYPEYRDGVLFSALFMFLCIFVLIYLALMAMALFAKHRQKKLDRELEDEET